MQQAHELVSEIISKVGFNPGGVNIELIRDIDDNLYVLEIGARSGGNYMPQLEFHASDFDLVKANVDVLLGKEIAMEYVVPRKKYYVQVILHAKFPGIFNDLKFPSTDSKLMEEAIYFEKGERFCKYRNSNDVIGVLIFELSNYKLLQKFNRFLEKNDGLK